MNDIINDVSDNLLDSVCIKSEVEIILDDLISDIEKDHEYINYINQLMKMILIIVIIPNSTKKFFKCWLLLIS